MKKQPDLYYSGGVWDVILSDLSRLKKPTLLNFFKAYLLPRGTTFRYNVWFRITQWTRTSKWKKYSIGLFAYYLLRHYEYKYGIHTNANIYVGRGLLVVHGDGVYLNAKRIGENFTCFQGVTLGNKDGGIPTIMDNVTVYTNAVICGEVTLENGCVVGAQSYVDKDIPKNVLVAGIPARVLDKKTD